jgi:plastocyanin
MNKYIILLIVLVALIGSGIVYRVFLLPDSMKPVDTGVVKEVTVTIPKNSWSFVPETIDANLGDTLKLTFVNEDDYDHGVGIDAYGVSQRIPARATLQIPPFVVTKAGNFQFYCSVSCSEGIAENGPYKGEQRSHFDQIGTICVHRTPGDFECMNKAPTSDELKAREEAERIELEATEKAAGGAIEETEIPQ